MSAPLALRLARGIIRAVAVLVPGVARADWVREWHAELHHQSHHRSRQQPFTWRTHMALITRALGALPDAAWLRRQFTLDADAVHDAGHAVRMLVKTPGFTAIALLVFAVGIGAATAIVSIADALFMRPMAVAQPERVVTLWQHNRETGAGRLDVAPGNALDWMARARSFEAVAMAEPMRFNTNFAGREPDYVYAAIVGEQFFSVLGTPVLHGRSFLPQEHQRGGPRVVVMSHTMWASRYASDPSIVGSSLRLDAGDTLHRRRRAAARPGAAPVRRSRETPRADALDAEAGVPAGGSHAAHAELLERDRAAPAGRVGGGGAGGAHRDLDPAGRPVSADQRADLGRGGAAPRPSRRQSARRPADADRGGGDPVDRGVRQRRQPAPGARRVARPGVRGAPGPRRSPLPPGPADAGRDAAAGGRRRRDWPGGRALGARHDCGAAAARHRPRRRHPD